MAHDPAADGSLGSDDKATSPDEGGKVSATSMFAAVPAPLPAAAPTDPPAAPAPVPASPDSSAVTPSLPAGMPVVHEVVFPAPGASEGSASILSSLRSLAADEKVRAAELPPSAFTKSELPAAELPAIKSEAQPSAVQSPASAGFTQLLRALSEKPATPPSASPNPPPAQGSPKPAQTPSSSAASFTRLLRALDDDRATQPPSHGAGVPDRLELTATQMSTPNAEAAPKPAPREPEISATSSISEAPTAVFQVPPFPQPPSSEPHIASAPGSFTQLFQTVAPEAANQTRSEAETAPIELPTPPPETPKPAGSFTQLFQAIDSPKASASTPVMPPTSSPMPTAHQNQSFGDFTQLFQSIGPAKASAAAPVQPAPSQATPEAPQNQPPGDFTQLFRAVNSSPDSVPPAASPQLTSPPKAPPAQSGSSFTELFRAIDPADNPPPPKPASSRPQSSMAAVPSTTPEPQPGGTFTQMFRAADSHQAPGAGSSRPQQSWSQAPQPQGGYVAPPLPSGPLPPEPPRSDAGSLTQLLRTLDPSVPTPESASPPPASRPDAFTSLYGERQPMTTPVERMQSTPSAPNFNQPPGTEFAAPGVSPEPSSQPGGSSDFTRIIQASSLREQSLKRGEQSVEAAKPAAPPAPPPAQPQMPGFPPAAPQFPHPSVLPPMNFHHGNMTPAAQSFKPPAPNLSPAQWMPPEPPPPAPTPVTAQPLLPLILIGVIFILIVVLVAVVFLLKR